MIARAATRDISLGLAEAPAVCLLGPRQVGRTTLAHEILRHRSGIYLDLESETDLVKLVDPAGTEASYYRTSGGAKVSLLLRLPGAELWAIEIEVNPYVGESETILDEINALLAGHYAFTADQLDFIINYNIKYRLGLEAGKE